MRLGLFIPVSLQHDLQFASHVCRLPADQMMDVISNGGRQPASVAPA
jgi:hypothetical protein